MLKLFYKKRETDEDLSRMAWDLLETACLKEGILHPRDRIIYGKKLYKGEITPSSFLSEELYNHYKNHDYHTVYICEIEKIEEKE